MKFQNTLGKVPEPKEDYDIANKIYVDDNIGALDFDELTGQLSNDQIPDNEIEGVKLVDGTIQGVKLVDGAVVNNKIQDNTISDSKIANVALVKIIQEGATDGQVLTWSDANSKYEPQDP